MNFNQTVETNAVTQTKMTKLRELKRHEQKLLKKVDFLTWKSDGVNDNFRKQMLHVINKYKLAGGEKEFFE